MDATHKIQDGIHALSFGHHYCPAKGNKKVQNLSKMCYKDFTQVLVTQGDFGHEFS